MNDLSFPKVQEFFTARELAEMAGRWGYKGLPHSESGVIRRAKRYGWNGHTFDAEVADPNSYRAMRPEITSIMDVATRRLVGWAISRKENVIAVTEALRNACLENGIPAVFYTDRGAGYKNKTFDDNGNGLMGRLGIDKMEALPYSICARPFQFRCQPLSGKRLAPKMRSAGLSVRTKSLPHGHSNTQTN